MPPICSKEKVMKRLTLLLAMFLAAMMSHAGIADYYAFSATTGTYAPITGTPVTSVQDDDAISAPIPLGFTFLYGTQSFTDIRISSNGWVGIGNSLDYYDYDNDLTSTTTIPVIAPLWDDLSLSNGSAQYLLSGSAPNRVFTVQYTDAAWDYSAVNGFSFQVRLYETGMVELSYGPTTGAPAGADASIGINMSPGGTGWFYSVTPGTPSTASTTGSNNNIAVFPGSGTVYTFSPVATYPNDLSGVSVTGNPSPTVGTQFTYTVTVNNPGSNPQSTWQVKLFHGAGIEIASQAGTAIAAGQSLSFDFPWTPAAAGNDVLYGKVFLTGDQNTANDQTPNLNLNIQAPGSGSVTVGTGNELARMPMDFYWMNSLYECLFLNSELNFTGTINALEFYTDFVTNTPTGTTVIWLGTTDQTDLVPGCIPASQLTQVFNGVITYPSGQNTIHIELATPFTYLTGTLVMMVHRPMDLQYYSTMDRFQCQTIGTNRARKAYSDSTILDPENMPVNSDLMGQFPKTKFFYTTGSANHDPETPVLDTQLTGNHPNPFRAETSIGFRMKDAQTATLAIYNVKGQLVRTLVNETRSAGDHSVTWNGRDESGNAVSAGIYFCRLTTGKQSDTSKLILMK